MITLPYTPKDISCHFTKKRFTTQILYPEEQSCIEGYEPNRLFEFCTGRHCAHRSLESIHKKAPVLKQNTGAPLWPKHTIGSISHSQKLTGAMVSTTNKYSSIGLDIETIGRVSSDLWDLFFTPNEIALLVQQTIEDQKYLSTLFFSMKEAFYKMQFPFTQTFMEFYDCEIVKKNEKYDIKILTDKFSSIEQPLSFETYYMTYEDQVITYILRP